MTHIPNSVPVFKLYGENQAWPSLDLLHCESIPIRSRMHHWEIKPHRHADLYQLLYVQRGTALIEIEGRVSEIREAAIQVTPPLCVHGFRFSENTEGYVLSVATPLVAQLERQLDAPLTLLSSAGCYPLGQDRSRLNALFATLLREYESSEPSRDLLLHSLVSVLMVWISRQRPTGSAPASRDEHNNQYLARFIRLVESHYREHLSVDDLAHRTGLSSVHLNNLCRQLTGQTALQIIHQRLLLEAKRNLIYTTMNISQLADHLGFSDPAYFSRFFRRLSGTSPQAFRQAAAQDEQRRLFPGAREFS